MVNDNKKCEDTSICIVGMGFVGLTLGVALADVGYNIYGVEKNPEILNQLCAGEPHFFEPGLKKSMSKNQERGKLIFSASMPDNWTGGVFIVTVGTPLLDDLSINLSGIKSACEQINSVLNEGDLIIFRSTLAVGVTRSVALPYLNSSQKGFDLAFCPERTLEGNALQELKTLPQIISGLSERAVERSRKIFDSLTQSVITCSSVETAEMIKLVDNSSRDLQFAYSNEISLACDSIGVSAIEVINNGKLGYPRTNLAMPGPVGGPCLEKDSHILASSFSPLGIDMKLTRTARSVNEDLPYATIKRLSSVYTEQNSTSYAQKIGVLGVAFKGSPETNDLRGSMAKPIVHQAKYFFDCDKFACFDPMVDKDKIKELGLVAEESLDSLFLNCGIVLILNNHLAFKQMDLNTLSSFMKEGGIIYDYWNLFKSADLNLANGVRYLALGSGK